MKKHILIKIFLIGLVLFTGKLPALGQEVNIRCEVFSFDSNLSGNKAMSKLGNFSVIKKGEKGAITKFYRLPRTKLMLSVFLIYDTEEDTPSGDQLSMAMLLGKKKFPKFLPDSDEENWMKDVAGLAQTGYPMKAFDKGDEGVLSTAFFGKKKLIQKCKKNKER